MKVKLIAILLLCFGHTGLQAQTVFLTTGGNGSGGSYSVSYSVGQIFYTTYIDSNYSVSPGVQQPYEIFFGLEEVKGINLICSAYPNPTSIFLKLKIENYKTENLTYRLYDILGKLLINKKIESNETNIVMSHLVPAVYFLKVTDNNKVIKSFKIIKN